MSVTCKPKSKLEFHLLGSLNSHVSALTYGHIVTFFDVTDFTQHKRCESRDFKKSHTVTFFDVTDFTGFSQMVT